MIKIGKKKILAFDLVLIISLIIGGILLIMGYYYKMTGQWGGF